MQSALSIIATPDVDAAPAVADTPALLAATTATLDAFARAMESVAGNADETAAGKLVASMAALLNAVARQIDHA